MKTTVAGQISSLDKTVLGLESFPADILYRAVIGWFLVPVYLGLGGEIASPWRVLGFFLLVLAALRIGPGVLRRLLPFSREVKRVWAERRALSKRYDSYQWRKLFGLGLGWLAYLLSTGNNRNVPFILATACLVAGSLGLAFWYRTGKVLATQAEGASASA